MDFKPILGKTTESYLGADALFHNNIDINDWYLSKSVDTLQKITLICGFWFSSKENQSKKPEERITAQNSKFMDMFGDVERVTVQKALLNAEKMGILTRKFVNRDKELIDKSDAHGMTKRRIIFNPNKAKELLTAVGKDEIKKLGYKPRSREIRLISRRPFTLIDKMIKDLVKDIRKTQVSDVQTRKNKISSVLLEKQFKQFKNFSSVPNEYIAAPDNVLSSFSFLLHQPSDAVDRYDKAQ